MTLYLITLFACQGAAPQKGQGVIYSWAKNDVNPFGQGIL
jgi:hypothetical protein